MMLFGKIKSWCAVVVVLLLLNGCVKEKLGYSDESGADLKINLLTKSVIGQSVEDGLIVSDIRIVVMKGATVVFNKSTKGGLMEDATTSPNVDGTSLFILPLKQGVYKIAVIGNETAEMTQALDALTMSSDISKITVAGLFTEVNIPLYRELDISVRHSTTDPTKGEVQIAGKSSWDSELLMPLERIQTRVSLYIRKNTGNDKTIVINKAELAQVPTFVYLSPRSFDHIGHQTITPYDDATGITFDTNVTAGIDDYASYTEIFSDGNIFPENNMNNPSDNTKATSLKLQGTYGGSAVNYQFDINLNNNYALLRNTHYKIYATLKTDGDIEAQDIVISPELWDGKKIDVELLTPYLNVQELNLNLKIDAVGTDANHYHLHYWTNQDTTHVEPKMKRFDDKAGDVVMNVSDVFNDLSGLGATNNHFNTKVDKENGGYTGYLDIDIKTGYTFPQNTNQYRIVLNANGLRREITITIAKTTALNPTHIGYTPWIGTFHRWNQTGERVIAAEHSGKWSAMVMDEGSNSDNFVVITKSKSIDTALGTDNPDDAENHQLIGKLNDAPPVTAENLHDAKSKTGIEGDGAIYFRIGLKSTLSSPTSKPRYARVKLTTTSGTYYLYVRQGEADDYIYDNNESPVQLNSDGAETSPFDMTEDRTEARKISPYNLGVSRPTAGGSLLNNHYQFADNEKAIFVNYPTMAGWYFTWYFCGSTPYYNGVSNSTLIDEYDKSYRKAYHPYNPAYNFSWRINDYPSVNAKNSFKFQFYVPDKNNDPCPVGYEMMSHKEVLHSLYKSFLKFTPEYNKSYQFKVQNETAINYLWGYYADGYYDRRPTRTLAHMGGDNYYRPYQIAGYNADVAYMGVLFYNHDTGKNNSVFLPGGGTRSGNGDMSYPNECGALSNIGGRATYFLKDNFSSSNTQNGIGVIELAAKPGSDTSYGQPTTNTYEFNFAFNSIGWNATPMRCVRTNYPTVETSVVVFDWNDATPSIGGTIVVGAAANNTYTSESGKTISFTGTNFIPIAATTFTKGGNVVVFKGWNTKADGKGTSYDIISGSMRLSPGVHILYAQYQ